MFSRYAIVDKETGGRVFGPEGAAARLGIPRSTLESKIKSLKIDKNRFRTLSEIEGSRSRLVFLSAGEFISWVAVWLLNCVREV